eukprot:TRINITY_DN34494_c0_g1_i2.p1 TRINITY_DN34494_c0_g1~~TRINITY_DN34494_c0_g1_i2.p1  ORF type:complete len:121 (-),score=19.78 TRINITY_DN34494_c0_g1_i2:60-422(-)
MPSSCCAALGCNGIPPDYPKATQEIPYAQLAGTYEDMDCPMCKTKVCGGPCLCMMFMVGPCPMSCAGTCPAGTNCYTNYQGYFFTVVDENTAVSGCWPLCGSSVIRKQGAAGAPKQAEMK